MTSSNSVQFNEGLPDTTVLPTYHQFEVNFAPVNQHSNGKTNSLKIYYFPFEHGQIQIQIPLLFWNLPGCGSNTVRQAALLAKIPSTVECFGVAMGCASGMKAITVAAQAIAMGQAPA